ncbi:MAG: hypothetical protein R3B89_06680 [Polyangiaceae bacterium]
MAIQYALGMELALPTPGVKDIGVFNREVLLAAVVDQVALDDDYELRVILDWDTPVDCPHDVKEGEMLFLVASDRGGPLPSETAQTVIAKADAIGRSGELWKALGPVFIGPLMDANRMLILPPHCVSQLSNTHSNNPLSGVAYVSAVEMKKLVAEIEPHAGVEHLSKLLALAIEEHLVLSARIED